MRFGNVERKRIVRVYHGDSKSECGQVARETYTGRFGTAELMFNCRESDGVQCVGKFGRVIDTRGGFRINDDKL